MWHQSAHCEVYPTRVPSKDVTIMVSGVIVHVSIFSTISLKVPAIIVVLLSIGSSLAFKSWSISARCKRKRSWLFKIFRVCQDMLVGIRYRDFSIFLISCSCCDNGWSGQWLASNGGGGGCLKECHGSSGNKAAGRLWWLDWVFLKLLITSSQPRTILLIILM